MVRNASAIPQVGMPADATLGSPDVILPPVQAASTDLQSSLEKAFANRKY